MTTTWCSCMGFGGFAPSINTCRLQSKVVKHPNTALHSSYSIYASTQPPAARASSIKAKSLERFKIVLVSPKTPGNIGATARLVANFEFASLSIVSPRCDPLSEEALNLAVNAENILSTCSIVPTLNHALIDCTSAIAFTRRAGGGRVVYPSLTKLFQSFPDLLIPPSPPSDNNDDDVNSTLKSIPHPTITTTPNKIALVFGREESGLAENEVSACSVACSIPTGTMQPSLNLSHSVAVVGSWLFENVNERINNNNSNSDGVVYKTRKEREALLPATLEEVEALLVKVVALMQRAGIDARESAGGENSGRRRMMAGHLRSLLLRGRVTRQELLSVHGLVKEIDKRVVK